jgi:outer membrane protein assembly factor BamB
VPGGANIDDKKQIYLTSLDGIRKFSPDGELLWTWKRNNDEELPDMSSLYNGAVYTSTTAGRIIAISMETGKTLWITKLASTDGNNGWVSAHAGVVITGSDAMDDIRGRPGCCGAADQFVTGLNATDGSILWKFQPEAPVWNFMASFADDGTFTFQDLEGRAYRCSLEDGHQIWKNGGAYGTWTDGTSTLGPNGVVYAVNTFHMGNNGPDAPGMVSAYRLEDGKLLWNTTVPRPPNNIPAIGRLAGREGLSLVQPIGQQVMKGAPTDIYALDAETGEVQWIFNGPTQKNFFVAGDSNIEAGVQRAMAGVRPITLPNPWSAPTIDGAGKVYIGSEEGLFYALVDANGDGHVDGPDEVSSFDTLACFSGSSSAAHAPGMMVAASIDAMYVFKQ